MAKNEFGMTEDEVTLDLGEQLMAALAENAKLREALGVAEKALEEVSDDCSELSRVAGIEPAEARTWKAIGAKALKASAQIQSLRTGGA